MARRSSEAPHGPLHGVRVLEFSLVYAAPYAGLQLADLGADVIKVEPPGGDPIRYLGTPVPGHSKSFQWANRGKRSLVLDLSRPGAQAVVHRLLPRCDVVLLNYRPGVAARLGLDYASLARIKPDLIYADISGFGSQGPLAGRSASDIVAQAYGGTVALDAKTDAGGAPVWPAIPVADLPAGLATAAGILAALYHRERTGDGQQVSVSLLRTVMQMAYIHVMEEPVNDSALRDFMEQAVARVRERGGSYAEMIEARNATSMRGSPMSLYFTGYRARDGGLVLGALTPANRRAVRAVLGIEDDPSDDPGYDGSDPANQDLIERLRLRIREIFAQRTVADWVSRLETAGVPVAPVLLPEEVSRHPQAGLHMVELEHEVTGPQRQVAPLFEMTGSPTGARSAAPVAGADSDAVLAEVGDFDADEVRGLREAGVVH
jgi:crotonobetainyl-CoA:carnitine CoA-transferase CaiB-like acyl-CoA transferase